MSKNKALVDQRMGKLEDSLLKISLSVEELITGMVAEKESILQTLKAMSKGITNTVDSHRGELNSMQTRITDLEHLAHGSQSQQTVMMGFAATVVIALAATAVILGGFKADIATRVDILEIHYKQHRIDRTRQLHERTVIRSSNDRQIDAKGK